MTLYNENGYVIPSGALNSPLMLKLMRDTMAKPIFGAASQVEILGANGYPVTLRRVPIGRKFDVPLPKRLQPLGVDISWP